MKKEYGQFYTINNPFENKLFNEWLLKIENLENETILEPFAGTKNILKLLKEKGLKNKWKCFDIDDQCVEKTKNDFYKVEKLDSLKCFPKGFNVAITNPPYLAKNSATRSGIEFPESIYDDLYKLSLSRMLENVNYVAAIIPASFLTQNLFHNRLFGVVSLNKKMFDDTEIPVCLALFIPEKDKEYQDDFHIYVNSFDLGTYNSYINKLEIPSSFYRYKFNDPNGQIGLLAIDNTKSNSIRFVLGNEIDSSLIKNSSRAITKIRLYTEPSNIDAFVAIVNKKLNEYRNNTFDLFLTPFRGIRKDNQFRRRLDFKIAKLILDLAMNEFEDKRKVS